MSLSHRDGYKPAPGTDRVPTSLRAVIYGTLTDRQSTSDRLLITADTIGSASAEVDDAELTCALAALADALRTLAPYYPS